MHILAIHAQKNAGCQMWEIPISRCPPFMVGRTLQSETGSPDALEFFHNFTFSHYHTTISSLRYTQMTLPILSSSSKIYFHSINKYLRNHWRSPLWCWHWLVCVPLDRDTKHPVYRLFVDRRRVRGYNLCRRAKLKVLTKSGFRSTWIRTLLATLLVDSRFRHQCTGKG